MKASRKVLGLLLVIGMLLSCAAASYATATKVPKFTTSKIPDAIWGNEYEATIEVQDNTDSSDNIVLVTIPDAALAKLGEFGVNVGITEAGVILSADSLSSDALVKMSSGYKFTVTATNQYEKKAGDGKWQKGTTKKDYTLKLKANAPKFTTKSLSAFTKAEAGESTIDITGSTPMTFKAYIAKKDIEKAGITLPSASKDLVLTDAPDSITGFAITSEDVEGGIQLKLTKDADSGGSFKNLPITIEADNVMTSIKKKPVTKVYKVTMTGTAPEWYLTEGPASLGSYPIKVSDDFKEFMFTAKSDDAVNFTFKASGDTPMKLTASPKDGSAGLSIKTSSDIPGVVVILPAKKAEAKTTKLKLVAENGEGKVALNLSLVGQDRPKIDYDKNKYYKEVEQGKKFSFTPKLKSGTKPIKWYIHPDSPLKSKDLEASYDIKIDEDKGTLSGTPANVTLSTDGKTYARNTVWIYAENSAGSSDIASVDIGVVGSKPKLDSNSKNGFELVRGTVVSGDDYTLKADGIDSKDLTWQIEPKGGKSKMSDYFKGLDFVSKDGMISGDPQTAGKASVPIIIDHYGSKAKASVKITVYDPTPSIVSTDKGIILFRNVKVDATKHKTTSAYIQKMTLKMSDDMKATGSSKISWKATKPDDKALSVKIVNGSDKNGNTVTLEVTLGKGKELEVNDSNDVLPFSATFDVTAKNSGSPKSEQTDTITITVQVTSSDTFPASVAEGRTEEMTIGETALLEEDIVTDEELTAELGEGEVTIGTERTVGMLTAGQAQVLDEGRFVIAAILPEISATADGQYGFEVDLAENVKAGAKLYWFAFPKDAPDSEDDQIADFFTLEGADTEVVPEDHAVAVYPWMRAGVTYGPVIAVKAEDAEEGEAVTEGELEKTAEEEAASETTEADEAAE